MFSLWRRYPTPASSPVDTICRTVRIPNDEALIIAFNELVGALGNPGVWDDSQGGLSAKEAASSGAEIMLWEEGCMIGSIAPYASQNPPPNMLTCDGSLYNRADYPHLYAVLHPAFIVDADTFRVPDLRDRFVLGMSGGNSTVIVNSAGGNREHNNMPPYMALHWGIVAR